MAKHCPNRKDKEIVKVVENTEIVDEGNFCFSIGQIDSEKWCFDSGATSHVCKKLNSFTNVNDFRCEKLNLATNSSTETTAIGTVKFGVESYGKTASLTLKDVLHAPALRTNLLSVSKITSSGYEVLFKEQEAHIVTKQGDIHDS